MLARTSCACANIPAKSFIRQSQKRQAKRQRVTANPTADQPNTPSAGSLKGADQRSSMASVGRLQRFGDCELSTRCRQYLLSGTRTDSKDMAAVTSGG